MSKSSLEHKKKAPKSLTFAVVTVSTSKYHLKQPNNVFTDDKSGDLIVQLVKKANHKVSFRQLIPDNPILIRETVLRLSEMEDIDVIVLTGGTGITRSDLTVETVGLLLEKDIPGFGEILRKIGYEKIGSAAVLTRALAGIRNGKAVFCIPGSPDAVQTAVENLILPEASHIVKHSRE